MLEIIWFPPGKGDPKWQSVNRSSRRKEAHSSNSELRTPNSQLDQSLLTSAATKADEFYDSSAPLFLGIDHTAIVVSDTERSLAFYRDLLGMRVAGGAENYGTEQEHLNQVFGARLRITALRAERGLGIEFLEYIAPPGGRPLSDDAKANDLLFWTTNLETDQLDGLAENFREHRMKFVSTPTLDSPQKQFLFPRSLIIRDPDGHALKLIQPASSSSTAATR